MIVLYQILAFAIVLGIIVFVHELGHFFAARLMGVRVEVFSFGIGKRLVGKKIGDTDFRISLIPLGGFVRMAGEEDFENKTPRPDEFHAKNRAQKIFILSMGSIMNLFLAFVILFFIALGGVETEAYKSEPPRIGHVEEKSPAAEAGIRKNDVIRKVAGRRVMNWEDLELAIRANPGDRLDVVYERNGLVRHTELSVATRTEYNVGYAGLFWEHRAVVLDVQPDSPAAAAGLQAGDLILSVNGETVNYFEISDFIGARADQPLHFEIRRDDRVIRRTIRPQTVDGRGRIGINLGPHSPITISHYSIFGAVKHSGREMLKLALLTFNAFKKLIVGKLSPKNLSGPIEIAKFSQRAMESGLSNFFILIAFISLQLGIINLFPIPVLDGGHLMIYTIEAAIRREFSPKIKSLLMNIGLFFLIALMVFVVLNDVAKALPNGWRSIIPF